MPIRTTYFIIPVGPKFPHSQWLKLSKLCRQGYSCSIAHRGMSRFVPAHRPLFWITKTIKPGNIEADVDSSLGRVKLSIQPGELQPLCLTAVRSRVQILARTCWGYTKKSWNSFPGFVRLSWQFFCFLTLETRVSEIDTRPIQMLIEMLVSRSFLLSKSGGLKLTVFWGWNRMKWA